MDKPDDFQALGEAHGEELADLAAKLFRQGLTADVWAEWKRHRLAALADDFRVAGASEEEIAEWALACSRAYMSSMVETRARSGADLQLMMQPVEGRVGPIRAICGTFIEGLS